MHRSDLAVAVDTTVTDEEFAFSAGQGRTVSPMFAKQQRAVEKRILVADWLHQLTGAVVPTESDEAFRTALSDGVTLCRLLNALQPNTIPRVLEGGVDGSTGELRQTFENVANFITASAKFTAEVFCVRDLEERSGERPQVVECLMSLRDWHLASQAASMQSAQHSARSTPGAAAGGMGGGPHATPSPRSAAGSARPSPQRAGGAAGGPGAAGFSFTPIAQDFVQKHGAHSAVADGGIPQLMRSCTNMLKSKMGMPATPPLGRGGALPTETALEAVGPVLESVLANLTAEYEKRLLAKDQEMKLSQEAMERMRKQIGALQSEVQYWQETCAQFKALPAHPTDGLNAAEREEYEERIRQEREAAQRRLEEAEEALQQKEAELTYDLEEKEAELEELKEELEKMQDIHQRLAEVREENRVLYNTVQDLRGNIRVFCRIRPSGATGDQSQIVGETIDDQQLRLYNPKTGKDSIFKFDRVFGENSTQEEVYEESKPLIRSVLDGYNVCIFAYGQTGSGKTHTMSGTDVEHYSGRGINYRALDDLFDIRAQRRNEVEYDINVQMLEIYNENLRDLLVSEEEARQQRSLELRDTQRSGCNVPDAIQRAVSCTEDVLKVMALGARNRAVAETKMNERSSRSHSVLTVTVDGTNLTTHEKTHGCLHLIDLAGSERVGKSGAEGDQLKEATHINTSLSALGHVMTSLASKAKHVPFRNSKLTRLLEDSLSGQAKSMMFIHIAPEWNSACESRCTLDFGKRVTEVTLGAAKKNTESAAVFEARELEKKLKVEQQKAAEERQRAAEERQRASQEAQRAQQEAQRAEQEALQRMKLEAELEALRAQLSRHGTSISSGGSSPSSISECDMIRAYHPPAAATGLTPQRAARSLAPLTAAMMPRPDSSASASSSPNPRGATSRGMTPRGGGGAHTPRAGTPKAATPKATSSGEELWLQRRARRQQHPYPQQQQQQRGVGSGASRRGHPSSRHLLGPLPRAASAPPPADRRHGPGHSLPAGPVRAPSPLLPSGGKLSRLNAGEQGSDKRLRQRPPTLSKLNLERVVSSEENAGNTPLSSSGSGTAASKQTLLSKIPTPSSGSLTARGVNGGAPKTTPQVSSIPRPQTARESPEDTKVRRASLPAAASGGGGKAAGPTTSRGPKPSVSVGRSRAGSTDGGQPTTRVMKPAGSFRVVNRWT